MFIADCDNCDLEEGRIDAGFLPDPCSCGYYRCYKEHGQWKAIKQDCPRCTEWSREKLTCDHVKDGGTCMQYQSSGPKVDVTEGIE